MDTLIFYATKGRDMEGSKSELDGADSHVQPVDSQL
jgi:hypothetical protein